jgi:hypothetical protein
VNPVATAIVAGALIVGGKWARNQTPNVDNAIGVAGVALGLALLEEASVKVSRAFAALILISLAVVHLPTIVKSLGFGEAKK